NDVVFTHDLDGRLLSINRAAQRVMGFSAGELVGRNWTDVLVPEHRELALQMIERTVERGGATSYQVDALRGDGHPVSLEVSGRLICEGGRPASVPALRLCLEQLAADKDLTFELENLLTREPPPETRAVLYRIAREALANVRKHAGAGRVTVSVAERDRGFLIRVRDDGRGLPISALRTAQASGAFGFDEMRERAELAGGWWKAHNDPRGGTVVEFWVPVEMQRDPPAA